MRSVTTPTVESNADSLALLSAVEDGDAARVRSLLSEGSSADSALRGGETPLMRAAARGHEEVARALLDAKADVNARRADGFTPLVLAVFFGHDDVVRLLIERGADVHAQTRLGTTAASWAASRGFAGVSELLRNAEAARPRPAMDARAETEAEREAVTVANAETVKVSDAEALKAEGARAASRDVTEAKASDDVLKFSRASSKSGDTDEAPHVHLRRDERVPAHPSAGAFRLGSFLSSWQGSVGVALLLTALGVAAFAIWSGNRSRVVNQQPAPLAPTPAPLAPAPDASIVVAQPSPLASPTPDAQAVLPASGMPPEAFYPAPNTSAQPFYVPPAASNAPNVPAVVSESGEPSNDDATRARRRAEAATNDPESRPPSSDNREGARAEDASRPATSRSTRGAESQTALPPATRTAPPPAATPERGKVIQWPPQ